MKGKWPTYNHSMQITPTRSHLEGGSPPPSHESPLIPPEPKILPRINYLNWSMHSVFNTLFHDLVTIKNIPLYGFFDFPRSYLEKLVFISHDAFPHKRLPLSPPKLLYPMNTYLPSIWWISNRLKLILNHVSKLIMKDSSLSHSLWDLANISSLLVLHPPSDLFYWNIW